MTPQFDIHGVHLILPVRNVYLFSEEGHYNSSGLITHCVCVIVHVFLVATLVIMSHSGQMGQ